ncbi:MAG: amidohydrolase family protein [Panacagrimonas sp.]
MSDHTHHPGCIDVHCHVVPVDLPLDPTGGKLSLWPQMKCDGGHTASFIAGSTTRKFDDRSWLPQRRIDFMDQHGIAVQMLSPVPELLGYWFEPSQTALLCRHVNDSIARMIEHGPTRFGGLGGLPMNDVSLAIAEARRLKSLGFAGVEIGSNVNGISPADPRFIDVLAALHELDLSIFVHGVRPATDGRLVGPEVLAPIIGIPMDTALCVGSFIGARVLDRFPDLRVAFSHGGGGIGSVIDRFQHVWTVMPDLKSQLARSPLEEARRYWYDCLTFSVDYTRFLIEKMGADRVFIGTDFPAGGMGLMDPVAFIDSLGLKSADLSDLLQGSAQRFLKMTDG